MLDMTDSQLTKVQTQLNQFVLENTNSSGTGDKKNWMKEDLLYGKTNQGGRNLINVRNYFKGLKLSWLRRYAILKYDDHWCDLIDQTLGITSYDQRKNVFNWGSEFISKSITATLPCISSILDSLSDIQRNWVANAVRGDNRKQMQPFFFNKNFPFQAVNQGKKLPHTSPADLNIHNTPEVRNLMLCDFHDKGHLIKDVEKIRRLIKQPTCHEYTIRGLIQHVKCKTDAHFSRTESLKINRTPPLHSLDTVCKLFENAKTGSKSYRMEMSQSNVIDYDVKKWRKKIPQSGVYLNLQLC